MPSVACIRMINQLNASNHAADALQLGADEHGVDLDIFDAHANAAMPWRLIQKKRRMRDGVAIPVPSRMFTNDDLLIDFTGLR